MLNILTERDLELSAYLENTMPRVFAYDRLPKEIRDAVKYTRRPIDCLTILNLWNTLRNVRMVIQAIAQMDQALIDMDEKRGN